MLCQIVESPRIKPKQKGWMMAKANVLCKARHTKYQPRWFRCPKCGAEPSDGKETFFIDDWDDDAHEDCVLLHERDLCVCLRCGYEGSGREVAQKLRKLDGVRPCPHCGGTGFVRVATIRE